MVGPWLVFPLALVVLCAGVGLLVERLGGRRLPDELLLPVGFCGLVVVLMLITTITPLAWASRWVALGLAIGGIVSGVDRLRAVRLDRWIVLMPVLVFGLVGATAVLTGQRSFLGYTSLGDASFNFSLAERVIEHGRSLSGLEPSTYRQTLENYFITSYPLGSHVVLGATSRLLGLDVAWTYQPFLAALPALFGLALVPLLDRAVPRRGAIVAAGITAGSGMVFTYAVMQQAIKELATLVVLGTAFGLAARLGTQRPTGRGAVPLAIAVAAGLGVLSLAVAPWIGPLLLVTLVVLAARWWRVARAPLLWQVGVFVVVAVVLSIPTLKLLSTFLSVTDSALTDGTAQGAVELGNLARSVPFGNAFGVWPAQDYRLGLTPTSWGAIALVGATVALTAVGLIAVVRRRAWGLMLFASISLLGFAVVAGRASPWAYGKALMLLSPALVLLAVVGVASVWHGRRVEATVLGIALLGGVLWTDAISYHQADPAPHARLGELERIGERFAGQGPASTFEFEEFGKYLLRDLAPNALTEGVNNGDVGLAPGRSVRFGVSSEPDDWSAADLSRYRLLVVRRGPLQSRPPSTFRRVYRGTSYSVWKRIAGAPAPIAHYPLGNRFSAAGPQACAAIGTVARQAQARDARIVYAPRPATDALDVAAAKLPANWGVDVTDPALLRPLGEGRVTGPVSVARAGTYRVWAEGSFGRRETIEVDGRPVGTAGPGLSPRLGAVAVGTVTLPRGRHRVSVFVGGGDLRPGNGGTNRLVGPVYLTSSGDVDATPVRSLPPAEYRRLCGRALDWIEVVPR